MPFPTPCEAPETGPPLERVYAPGHPIDLRRTLGPIHRGAGDPCHVVDGAAFWHAFRLASGPATLRLVQCPDRVLLTAWGPGAAEALDGVPALLGQADEPESFVPRHPVLAEAVRRFRGWRVPRTSRVLDALIPAILEQKVTSTEARRAWRHLVEAYGERAPGPTPRPMRISPPAAVWARIPSWDWHQAGVDGKRSRTTLVACGVAERLEQTLTMPHGEAERTLRLVPGIGIWTAAETVQRAHGSPDHASVGDLHLPGLVGWALAGEPWADDDRMLELLEPYAGQRFRAVRMCEMAVGAGLVPPRPRRAPRYAVRDFRRI